MKIVGATGLDGLWALEWSACYIHSDGSSIPFYSMSNGYKNNDFSDFYSFN